jgi:hypothetical protein
MHKMAKYYGRRHRIFFHDHVWARHIAMREYPNDLDAIWAAWLHLWIDDVCSSDPEYRKLLERRVKEAKKQRVWVKNWSNEMLGKAGKPARRKKRRGRKSPVLNACMNI